MNVTLIPHDHPHWNAEIERMGIDLRAPDNATLFPYHFLAVVLPRLGGFLAVVEEGSRRVGLGFLFPRLPAEADARAYTLRYHSLTGGRITLGSAATPVAIVDAVRARLPGMPEVVFYDPLAEHRYAPSYEQIGLLDIGRPNATEAQQIRFIQQTIWGNPPEFLYPSDIHSADFGIGTSLVARVDGVLAGFLFGFIKHDGPELPADWYGRFNGATRLESQTMGVLTDFRGMRIGNLLKRSQAAAAWAQGIGIVHWTVDPLQYPNAALNFGLLRAIAFNFYPDLYPFRNELNRVHASRFAITWLVGSKHVQDVPLHDSRAQVLDLSQRDEIPRVNRGWADIDFAQDAAIVAFEVPADWTGMQQNNLDVAIAWREASDRIFGHYVGSSPGQYVITGTGVDGERRYLIGERVSDELWNHLGAMA
jgi:predicted GNAT superfamily acetyltransferase